MNLYPKLQLTYNDVNRFRRKKKMILINRIDINEEAQYTQQRIA